MRYILRIGLIGFIICMWGCTNTKEYYSEYKDMLANDKGYDKVRERIKEGEYIYALTDSEDVYSYNDTLIRYDVNKDKIMTYSVGTAINGICVDDNYVYYINTKHSGSNNSYVCKINNDVFETTGKKNIDYMISNEYKNIVLTHIEMCDDILYAFGFDYDTKGVYSKMYVIDKKDLRCIKEQDFSDYIIDVTDACKVKNKLYIAGRSARKQDNENYEEIDNKYIYELELSSKGYGKKIRKIYVGDITYEIKYKEGNIYVSSYDEVLDEGRTVYELDNKGELVKKHKMKNKVRDIETIMRKGMG